MNFFNKMERRFGRYAISNISLILIICYGFGYAISIVNSSFLSYLSLNPWLVLHGQIWRLFTWILIPPGSFGMLTLISLYFYYSIGTALENTWGTFRYNYFLFSGMLLTVVGAFLIMIYYMVVYKDGAQALGGLDAMFREPGYIMEAMGVMAPDRAFRSINTYHVNLSIFLAFALTYPEARVFLFFIIPVKIKWLAVVDVVLTAYAFIGAPIPSKIIIGAAMLNVVIFFFMVGKFTPYSPRQVKRRAVYRAQTMQPRGVTRHKCAICGRSEEDGANLEFRFCSKCNGNYEYCQDHLFTHEHKK